MDLLTLKKNMDYKLKFDKLYEYDKQINRPSSSKLMFLGNHVFDFITYDSEVDELFAKKMIEVIDCILNKKNFDYQNKSTENYLNFLTMVNMPYLRDKIDWGTSIRGAWFDEVGYPSDEEKLYRVTCDWKIPKCDISKFFSELIEWIKM